MIAKSLNREKSIVRPVAVGLLLLLSACTTMLNAPEPGLDAKVKQASDAKQLKAGSATKADSIDQEDLSTKQTAVADDIERMTIDDVIRIEEPNTANLYDNSRYDFPITVNARVEGWIDYFTGRGRHHMERYLGRSSRYMPSMREILKANGLPEDLVYLALIESGFNMRARSKARAVGPWQFIKATGKRYGLRVDSWIDERRDWIKSTEAAAKYLKDLYLMFESWYLAASAYNAGENKILRAIDHVKSHNFWHISQTKSIRRETKDYIPKLIAAAIIAKNPTKYGFEDITYDEPLEYEMVALDFSVSLSTIAKLIDAPEEDLLDLNPMLIHGTLPARAGVTELRVPPGTSIIVQRALASLKNSGEVLATLPLQHTVRRGDTIRTIASKYRVKVNELAAANNLSPREKLSPGSTLVIPNRSLTSTLSRRSPSSSSISKVVDSESTNEKDGITKLHVVRRGESLWSISEKYQIPIHDLYRWNKLNSSSKIFPGKKLKIKPEHESKKDTATISVGSKEKTINAS